MIDLSAAHLKMVSEILKKHVPDCEIRVFGSRITGKAKPYSDIDLAIVGKQKIPKPILYNLKDDFEESNLPFRVDVLDWHAISEEFKKVIASGYEIL